VETITPLLARYLGALPSTGKAASRFEDRGVKFPDGQEDGDPQGARAAAARRRSPFFADAGNNETDGQQALTAAGVLRNSGCGACCARRCRHLRRLRQLLRQFEFSGARREAQADRARPISFRLPGFGTAGRLMSALDAPNSRAGGNQIHNSELVEATNRFPIFNVANQTEIVAA